MHNLFVFKMALCIKLVNVFTFSDYGDPRPVKNVSIDNNLKRKVSTTHRVEGSHCDVVAGTPLSVQGLDQTDDAAVAVNAEGVAVTAGAAGDGGQAVLDLTVDACWRGENHGQEIWQGGSFFIYDLI